MSKNNLPGSFRDPNGFLFFKNHTLLRQVNLLYKENYNFLMNSGLYKTLTDKNLLIPHEETTIDTQENGDVFKIIKPEVITFISYPYEWCFGQLKQAALLTLEIQKEALNHGMSLKDASAYNVQYYKGNVVFIDTLSFEIYKEGSPWVAYKQFCQHFLAPLALIVYKDIQLNQLSKVYLDGIPLDLAVKLLPKKAWLSISLFTHIYMHSKSQKYYENKTPDKKSLHIGKTSLYALIDNLESFINKLSLKASATQWGDYYNNNNYTDSSIEQKKQIVAEYLDKINPKNLWDIGGNTGMFGRIASDRGIDTVSFDIDPAAIEKSYNECIQKKETNILPLIMDFTNPSSCIGWAGEERMSLFKRGPADTILALAIIHHLAISNNVPLNDIADLLSKNCNSLIIEFVPKSDSQVKKLLESREDIFPNYTKEGFEKAFSVYFNIETFCSIENSQRTLYLLRKK